MMKGQIIKLTLIAIVLTACSNSEQLRNEDAVKAFEGPAAPTVVSDCILTEMSAVDPNNTIRRRREGDAIRLYADLGTSGRVGHYDIRITPLGTGSRAELRAAGNIWGTTNEPSDTESVIRSCLNQA